MKLNQAVMGSWGLGDWELKMTDSSGKIYSIKEQLKNQSLGSWVRDAMVIGCFIFMLFKPATEHARIEGAINERVSNIEKSIEKLSNGISNASVDNGLILSRIEGVLAREIPALRLEIKEVEHKVAIVETMMLASIKSQDSQVSQYRREVKNALIDVAYLQRQGDLLTTFHKEKLE